MAKNDKKKSKAKKSKDRAPPGNGKAKLPSWALPGIILLIALVTGAYVKTIDAGGDTALPENVEQTSAAETPERHLSEISLSERNSNEKLFWKDLRSAAATPYVASPECVDQYPACKKYGKNGCVSAPGWMVQYCPVTCQACHLKPTSVRCTHDFLNVSDVPAYDHGGSRTMETMFDNIEAKFAHYKPTIHSREPWVVTFDDFLTDDEIEGLKTAPGLDFVRSTDTGSYDEEKGAYNKIVSQSRTSNTAWCTEQCQGDTMVQSIQNKIAEVVNIPPSNWESFQVLQYGPGQYYKTHHDFVDANDLTGARLMTFFLYLSDVDEGGETDFPSLNITVTPKKGKALLWPSVLSEDLFKKDGRTMHQAKPVTKGYKWAANAWVHLHNYAVPNKWGCTGIFDDLDDSNVDNRE